MKIETSKRWCSPSEIKFCCEEMSNEVLDSEPSVFDIYFPKGKLKKVELCCGDKILKINFCPYCGEKIIIKGLKNGKKAID